MAQSIHVQGTGIGQAGQRGEDVRSDAWVSIELCESGGWQFHVRSKVAQLYGEAIRDDAGHVLRALGIENAHVEIDDRGALPFTLEARVEAAARRAGVHGEGDPRPQRMAPLPPASARDRCRRSRLYLPGNEPKFMINAGLHRPDAVILDLEDSVHPDEKDAARLLVRNALRCVDFGGAERMVRVNQGELGLADLDAVVAQGVDVVLVPKVERPDHVREVSDRIKRTLEREKVQRPVWLMPILESALGVERAYEIATASDRVVALTIGLEDYTADLGVVKTREGEESSYARERLIVAARAAGVQAIDSVYGDVGDEEGLRAWAQRARAMGFVGMGCVHPRQIRVLHAAFAPTPEELDKARRIVEAYEQAQAAGRSVVSLGSKMIDPPVVKRALKLVKQAEESAANDEAMGASRAETSPAEESR